MCGLTRQEVAEDRWFPTSFDCIKCKVDDNDQVMENTLFAEKLFIYGEFDFERTIL